MQKSIGTMPSPWLGLAGTTETDDMRGALSDESDIEEEAVVQIMKDLVI